MSECTAHTSPRLILTCSLFPLEIRIILKNVLLTLQELSEILLLAPSSALKVHIQRQCFVLFNTKSQGSYFPIFSTRREMMGVFRTSELPRCLLYRAAVCSAPPVPLRASRGLSSPFVQLMAFAAAVLQNKPCVTLALQYHRKAKDRVLFCLGLENG